MTKEDAKGGVPLSSARKSTPKGPAGSDSALEQVLGEIARDPALRFPNTVVFRLSQRPALLNVLEPDSGEAVELPFAGGGYTVYLADSAPTGLYGKPSALFAFRENELVARLSTQTAFDVNGAVLQPGWQRERGLDVVANLRGYVAEVRPLARQPLADLPAAALADLPSLAPPLRAEEGGPRAGSGEGGPVTSSGECVPTQLYIAIRFPSGIPEDPLNEESDRQREAFHLRGFDKGDHVVPGSLDDMIAQLNRAIPEKFCKCKGDFLIIGLFIHGYGGRGVGGDVGLLLHPPGQAKEYVQPAQLFAALAQVAKIKQAANAKKLAIIAPGCRSGRFFDTDVGPKHLPGAYLLTSAEGATVNDVARAAFMVELQKCILKVSSFADLLKCVKEAMRRLNEEGQVDESGQPVIHPTPRGGEL